MGSRGHFESDRHFGARDRNGLVHRSPSASEAPHRAVGDEASFATVVARHLARAMPDARGAVAVVSGRGTVLSAASFGGATGPTPSIVAGRSAAAVRAEIELADLYDVHERSADLGGAGERLLIALGRTIPPRADAGPIIDSITIAVEMVAHERRRVRCGLDRLAEALSDPGVPVLVVRRPGDVVAMNAPAAARFKDVAAAAFVETVLGIGWAAIEEARAGPGEARRIPCDLDLDLDPAFVTVTALGLHAGHHELALVRLHEPDAARATEPTTRSDFKDLSVRSLVGTDPGFLLARQRAERFARTSLPLRLQAETGAGKEVLARAIHDASPRSTGPFVPINCASINPDLLASELFGYGPGAFTGATVDGRDGRIAAAAGGSLFLDEVAEMPPALQASLLRVLEDGSYYRVGEAIERRADIRLICATWRDLTALVHDGRFRRDLYYRIKGACIRVPPLREREDVLEIANFLLDQLCFELKRGQARLDRAAIERIRAHAWPGNIRELRAALHHAVVMADERHMIAPEHLPPEVGVPDNPATIETLSDATDAFLGGRAAPLPPGGGEPGSIRLEQLQRRAFEDALATTDGNMAEAARRLGVSRSTAYRMADRYGLRRDA